MRDHLNSAAERSGKLPQRLADAAQLPYELETLWDDFLELHASRGSTGFGYARITFQDIDAWQRVTNSRLQQWQIEAIRVADSKYMAEAAKRKK